MKKEYGEGELKKRMRKRARRVKVYDLRAEDKKNTALMYNPFLVEQAIDEAKKDIASAFINQWFKVEGTPEQCKAFYKLFDDVKEKFVKWFGDKIC